MSKPLWKLPPAKVEQILRRRILLVVFICVGSLTGLILYETMSTNDEIPEPEPLARLSNQPAEFLSALPSDYSQWREATPEPKIKESEDASKAFESELSFEAKLPVVVDALPPSDNSYRLLAGSVLPGVMLTGINSDLPGQLVGQISTDVYDSATGSMLLIPAGTKVVGSYDSNQTFGQDRVFISWTQLSFPNGASKKLDKMVGASASGVSGLSDKVDHHYGRIFSGAILGSILGASAQIAVSSTDSSFGQLAVQGAAQNVNQAGQQITQKNLNIQPTIEIRPGTRFNVMVSRDLDLEEFIQ